MKKIFLILGSLILLTAACQKNQDHGQINPHTGNQNQAGNQSGGANPPQNSDWQTQTSKQYGYSIKYPTDFYFTDLQHLRNNTYMPICDEAGVSCIVYTGDAYKNTNFEGAGVSINLLSVIKTEIKCYDFKVSTNEAEKEAGIVNIGGIDFRSATGGEGAAGHFSQVQVYRNFHNNQCYELAQRVMSTNINNYDPSSGIKQFNQDEVWQKLQDIVKTFSFVADASK